MSITHLDARWSDFRRRYANNPERFDSIDGSVETWSRPITGAEDLPADVLALLGRTYPEFPYCVHTPALGLPQQPESFLFLGGDLLMVAKRGGLGLTLFRATLDSLDAVTVETALLQSSITFHPREGKSVTIPFNTVVDDLFAPVLDAFLASKGASVQEAAQLATVRPDPLEDLRARDHKYYTYALDILPGEGLRSRFYHPTAAAPAPGRRDRQIPAYLLAASGSMLYVLSGPKPFRTDSGSDYSLVVRYLPINETSGLSYQAVPGERGYRMVSFRSGAIAFELPLARSADAEFTAFAQSAQLPVLPAGERNGLNPALEAQRRRRVG